MFNLKSNVTGNQIRLLNRRRVELQGTTFQVTGRLALYQADVTPFIHRSVPHTSITYPSNGGKPGGGAKGGGTRTNRAVYGSLGSVASTTRMCLLVVAALQVASWPLRSPR